MEFEYFVYTLRNEDRTDITAFNETLDMLGRDRWELVQIVPLLNAPNPPVAVFKREYVFQGEPCDPDALVS